jgi:hypothetical protein
MDGSVHSQFAIWATKALAAWSDLDVILAPDLNVLGYTLACRSCQRSSSVSRRFARRAIRRSDSPAVDGAHHDDGSDAAARRAEDSRRAMSVTLLVGAGLLVRTLVKSERRRPRAARLRPVRLRRRGHTGAFGSGAGATQFTVVGVAPDSRYRSVRESLRRMAYFSYGKAGGVSDMYFEIRTSGDPLALMPQVGRLVQEYGPDLPLIKPMTQQQQFAASFTDERHFSRLASAFGLLAAILVASGLYGSLSYRVSRRTAEIGIRLALGARRGQVVWLVLGESLRICAIGLVIGLPLAITAARLLRPRFFGLQPDDPLSFGLAIAGITIVTIAATLLLARRALSVDPMLALRSE